MSDPLSIIHGPFGRVAFLRLDHSMVLHAHRECHIVFKIGGADIRFGVGTKEYPVTAHSALMINAWEPHFYNYRETGENTVLLAFYLNPKWLKEVDLRFSQCARPKFFAQPVEILTPMLSRKRDDVLDALGQVEPPSPQELENLIAAIFAEIVTMSPPRNDIALGKSRGELDYDARIRRIVDRVLSGDDPTARIEDMAASTGLSRAQFFRLFRSSTGLAPATFLSMRRMEACLIKLAKRDVPLQDIALELGFDTAGNFSRFFANVQGVAPSKYRKIVEVVSHGMPSVMVQNSQNLLRAPG